MPNNLSRGDRTLMALIIVMIVFGHGCRARARGGTTSLSDTALVVVDMWGPGPGLTPEQERSFEKWYGPFREDIIATVEKARANGALIIWGTGDCNKDEENSKLMQPGVNPTRVGKFNE